MICVRIAYTALNRETDRASFLAAHKAFLRNGSLTVLQSGPVFDQEGKQSGAIIVAETLDIETMKAICAQDPFVVHGIYHQATFFEWRITLGHVP